MSRRRRRSPLPALLAAAVALALAVLLTGCAAPVRGVQGRMQPRSGYRMSMPHRTPACPSTTPRPGGAVVHVHLMDMGHSGMMDRPSVMRLMAAPSVVAHGDVTFVATDRGRRTHELVVLPLPTGSSVRLPVDGSGKVSERGALGEASAPCAGGAGDGLRPGTTGWVTLRLRPGRYELVCNEPHHYARGMHAVLVVH